MPRPFEKNDYLSGQSLKLLHDWLSKHANPELLIAPDYRMADMLEDLDSILDGMWSDGIDAMGEDA